jgi:Predicted kinase related to dihydroxyacetone kinase
MGARGNSGVILSQIFRGFAKAAAGKQTLNAQDFVDAYANGAKVAYKAVMKPTEGTILTVVRESAQAGLNKVKQTEDLVESSMLFTKLARLPCRRPLNCCRCLKKSV